LIVDTVNSAIRAVNGDAVATRKDTDLIADLSFHPGLRLDFSPTEIDLTDKKTGTVVRVRPEGVTTKPNVWEIAQERLRARGIEPNREHVIDECMHILNTRYMGPDGNL